MLIFFLFQDADSKIKASRVEICQQWLSYYKNEGAEFHSILSADETRAHQETKYQSMEYHHNSSVKKKSKHRLQQEISCFFAADSYLFLWTISSECYTATLKILKQQFSRIQKYKEEFFCSMIIEGLIPHKPSKKLWN